VNLTLSVDEQLVERARKRPESLGKSLNQLVRDYLLKLAGNDDPERSIQDSGNSPQRVMPEAGIQA
jgi:Family of unknown function (DUF6364)